MLINNFTLFLDKFLTIVPSYSPLKSLSFFIDFSLILRDFRASLFLHTVHTDLYMSTYLPSLLYSFLLLDFWFPSEIIFLLPKADFYNFSWNCLFFFFSLPLFWKICFPSMELKDGKLFSASTLRFLFHCLLAFFIRNYIRNWFHKSLPSC